MKTTRGGRALRVRGWVVVGAGLFGVSVGCGEETPRSLSSTEETPSAAAKLAELQRSQRGEGYDFASFGDSLVAPTGAIGQAQQARVDRTGVRVGSKGRPSVRLHTEAIGRDGSMQTVADASSRSVGQEAVLDRGALQETYLTGPLGLEQTYRLSEKPAGEGPLAIEVGFDGLSPCSIEGRRDTVALVDADGRGAGSYSHLAAIDARGEEVPSHMEVTGDRVRLVMEDAEAVYPLVVDPLLAVQESKFLGDGSLGGSFLGRQVAVSGDWAAVSDDFGGNADQFHLHLYRRTGGSWSVGAWSVDSGSKGEGFGAALAIQGDTMLVGTASPNSFDKGSGVVLTRSGSTWSQEAVLKQSDPEAGADTVGAAVALDGDTAILGSPNNSYNGTVGNAGAAYVFVRSGSSWTQQAKLGPSDLVANNQFGLSVAVSGDVALVGTSVRASGALTNAGAVYVFTRSGTTWTQAPMPIVPSDLVTGSKFGSQISFSGNTFIVAAPGSGAAYVFTGGGSTWTQQAKLSDGIALYGTSVSIDGDRAVVGGPKQDVNIYQRTGSAWSIVGSPIENWSPDTIGYNSTFGSAVAVSGDALVVGDPGLNNFDPDSSGGLHVGGTFFYSLTDGSDAKACDSTSDCVSGFCVDHTCCNTDCGGDGCSACTVAKGADVDGTCKTFSGNVCGAGTCDAGACVLPAYAGPGWTDASTSPTPGTAYGVSLVPLADGSALIAASTTAVFRPSENLWVNASQYTSSYQQQPAAVQLANGEVLIVGWPSDGFDLNKPAGPDAYLYDPVLDYYDRMTDPATRVRSVKPLVRLTDGRVLVGGAKLQAYDPVTGKWSVIGTLPGGCGFNGNQLGSGKVMFTCTATSPAVNKVQICDATTGVCAAGASTLKTLVTSALPITLADGRVFFVGADASLSSQIYDPVADSWSATAPSLSAIASPVATRLPSGDVLVVGGTTTPVAESYHPGSDTWTTAPTPLYGNTDSNPAIVTLADGRALHVSNGKSEVYDSRAAVASTCVADGDCHSGFCVDGVCCDTACGADGCSVCSAAMGASVDGTCTDLTGTSCSGGTCDAGVCVPASVTSSTSSSTDASTGSGSGGTGGTATTSSTSAATSSSTDASTGSGSGGTGGTATTSPTSASTSTSTGASTSTSTSTSSSGGAGADGSGSGTSGGGCSCSTAPAETDLGQLAVLGLVGLGYSARRRRRDQREGSR